MAVARPGPSDARVPCPLCGGLIHPIAGKCKHCKADLAGHHAARPAASAPLPALQAAPSNGHAAAASVQDAPREARRDRSTPAPAPATTVNGHAHAKAPAPLVDPPVLPPRPTARSNSAGWAEPAPSGWRSWPVLVITLAMIAIIAAVVLMVWPATERADANNSLRPPPAPEHMPTDPGIKQPRPDRRPGAPKPTVPVPRTAPQSAPPSAPQVAPSGPSALDSQVDPTDDDDDVPTLKNPYANGHPSPRFNPSRPSGPAGTMMTMMLAHVCKKLTDCRSIDAVTADLCEQINGMPAVPPTSCPAATRCLEHIDTMSCASQPASLRQLASFMTQFRDCAEAARC